MLKLFFFLCLGYSFAKENFRFNTTVQAQCFNASYPGGPLCTQAGGCCSGHGTCLPNGTGVYCQCDSAPECSNATYTGTTCNLAPAASCPPAWQGSNSPTSVCPNSTVCNLNWAWSVYGHLTGSQDPEQGAPGNLLVREAAGLFADGVGTPYLWLSTSNLTDDVNQLINLMGLSNTSGTLTSGNMMGLGLLEVALKDIVDFEYDSTNNVTLCGNTYPTVKWQSNTGQNGIYKQFANNASGIIDLGPVYAWSHRVVRSSNATGTIITPYLDLTDALTHWNKTHHMSKEFTVALRFYASFHYYVARNLEEYFCGQNSTGTPIAINCTLLNNTPQGVADWVYEHARRSTIRFSQALLEQSVLQILLWHNSTDLVGYWEPIFEQFFRRDYNVTKLPTGGASGYTGSLPSVRAHQEWANDVTRGSLAHHLISGLDLLISMRNPNTDTANYALYSSTCAATYQNPNDAALIQDVISLLHTPLQQYGSTIRSQYKADLAIQLYRASEIGLASYESHILGLTNQSQTGLGGLSQDYHVYYGAQKETNSSRRFRNIISSLVLATTVPIGDAIMADRVGYFSFDSSQTWTGGNYHPDPQVGNPLGNFVPDFDTYNNGITPTLCYQSGGSCTTTSWNAAAVVLGYITDMEDVDAWFGVQENLPMTRSNGALFTVPGDQNGMPLPGQYPDSGQDSLKSELRAYSAWRLVPEFANTLFYQYDGINSLAVKEVQSEDTDPTGAPYPGHYLPNQVIDVIPTSIGWSSWFDGTCFTSSYLSSCARTIYTGYASAGSAGACGWYWQGPN